jgi:hypothetical protein
MGSDSFTTSVPTRILRDEAVASFLLDSLLRIMTGIVGIPACTRLKRCTQSFNKYKVAIPGSKLQRSAALFDFCAP